MLILQGIPVSPGVAIAEAVVIDNEGFRIPRRFVSRDAVDDELARLRDATDAVAEDIASNRDAISQQLGEQYGAIFSAHLQMLRDPKLHEELQELIRDRHYCPEYAVSRTMRRYAKVFQELDNPYLAERAHDIFDLEKRLLRNLLGRRREELSHITSPVIVLAHNLTPSETANLDPRFVMGFGTEIGGAGGHTSIVAKGLEIPAVVGVGNFLTDVSGGDLIVVDGDSGRVIVQPDQDTLAYYKHEAEEHRTFAQRLETLRDLPAETTDGSRVYISANIEFPHEVSACLRRGADGIGLYRTEFLYLGAENEPSEEEHFEAYASVVKEMDGRPVVIRTLDLGADKMGHLPLAEQEKNPFLGLRSIRISLRNLPLFRVQLRAILRASALGDVRIMFPLITTLHELRQAKMVLNDAMEDLEDEGVGFDRNIQTGMMVESPAAVVMIDKFLKEVDFVSIGTNDLVQYALAVDRSNNHVADLYQNGDPAVLRLLDMTIRAANEVDIPATMCGQMSAGMDYTMLLLGLGLRRFSVPSSAVPEIKKICRSVSISQCEDIAKRAMSMDSAREVDTFLREQLRQLVPDIMLHS
ncbi:MAG: phosphotransferase system enzyme I (PtsI) [Pirellulaceae bacterium]|jgi:phosphotransferase system enzyme I (PtsI)